MEKEPIASLKDKFLEYLRDKFDLSEDKEQEDGVLANVKKNVEFKGANLWILIFATFIASIGLNVNSIAVIIGAMLISPIMGPIMGVGLSIAINDFDLLKRSVRNFTLAILMSLIVSWIYFSVSPLTVAQSELLARTQPTTWDVLIAFLGGLAGIVAQSRKDRTGTVIPGVAIATALMPPLCTAGFGLATLNLEYFFGALYLFFINAVFISLATYSIVRLMKYQKKTFLDPMREKRIKRIMGALIGVMLVPSILLGFNIVNETVFETNAKKYTDIAFQFKETQVVDMQSSYSRKHQLIEITLLGKTISNDALESLRNQLVSYGLKGTELIIRQQSDNDSMHTTLKSLDKLHFISQSIISDKDKQIEELESKINDNKLNHIPVEDIVKEFGAISGFTDAKIAISKVPVYNIEGQVSDTIVTCYVKISKYENNTIPSDTYNLISDWLKVRTNSNTIKLIIE